MFLACPNRLAEYSSLVRNDHFFRLSDSGYSQCVKCYARGISLLQAILGVIDRKTFGNIERKNVCKLCVNISNG